MHNVTVISSQALSPLSDDMNVPVNTKITANFSEPMNLSTINNTTFTIVGAGLAPAQIEGIISYTGTTATFTPASVFVYNIKYTAAISSAVKDAAGNNMAANYSWSFTTEHVPAPAAPDITVSAGDGQTTISWNSVSGACIKR